MEKRVKAHSLAGLLWGYLLAAGALCIAVCFAALFSFQLLMNCGFILPASAGSEAAAQGAALAAGHTAASFPAGELPELCRWAVFSSPQADAAVLCTNMDAWHLEKARNAQRGGSGNLGYTQYHTVVPLADGAVAYFQYDYAVPYANPALRGKLPDFQAMFLAATALACLGGVVAVTRAVSRRLQADARLLAEAGSAIASGTLESWPQGKAHVREFACALATMDSLRQQLASALNSQWKAEALRRRQLAALTHDLKTPLTVISGNAELLCEDGLPAPQQALAQGIVRNALRAQQYVDSLRAVAALEAQKEERAETPAAPLLAALCKDAQALCTKAGLRFEAAVPQGGPAELFCAKNLLCRAVLNLVENAVSASPQGGLVSLQAECSGNFLCLRVLDEGPGFSPEALRLGTQAFYSGDAARNPAAGHMGLGLTIASEAAQLHGGRLSLSNRPQGGACAELCLPLG